MSDSPRHCVVVPVYNHALTVGQVVSGARRFLPVIVVDDGSTDETAAVLRAGSGIELVTLPANQGKGAALQAAFARAVELGYTHAITVDADGQHPVAVIPEMAATSRDHPEAILVGVRNLEAAQAPKLRRFSNALSNYGFRVAAGVSLADTQCGLRCYPLASVTRLNLEAERYAWELELLVRAAWARIPLFEYPVPVDYSKPTSRLSHFSPVLDFLRISRLQVRLVLQRLFLRRSRGSGSGPG